MVVSICLARMVTWKKKSPKVQATQRYAQPPQLFWNAGRDAKSELVLAPESSVGEDFYQPIVGRGAVFGDFDEDGDQDVVIAVSDGEPAVFRNDQSTGNHWLRVGLEGIQGNRDGIGAVVEVRLGERVLRQCVMPTRSYLSQCEKAVTFGLADRQSVDSITVVWPGGMREVFPVSGVDQAIVLRQGSGSADSTKAEAEVDSSAE